MIFNLLNRLKDYSDCKIIALSLNEGILSNKLKEIGIETYIIPENTNSFLKIFWKALKLFKGMKINVIHSHRYKENMLALILYKFLLAKCLVTTFHGWGVEYFEKSRGNGIRLITRINYFVMRHFFTCVAAVSHEIKNVLIKKHGFRENKVIVIHNGIEMPELYQLGKKPISGVFHIGTVGRLMPQKDFELFLEIAAKIRKKIENVRFSILGDGPLKNQLIQKARDLNIENYFEFYPPRQNPFPYYFSLDIYLNTSLFEGIPLTILEAMACKIPVIAPKVGGIPEIINNESNGILIDSRDPVKYANICIQLLDKQKLRQDLANSAAQTIKDHFSSRYMCESYLRVYKLTN